MNNEPPTASQRILAGVFGTFFSGIGLTVMSMNLSSWGGFHSPPIFFRVFGFFMSLPFVAVGGMAIYAAVTGRSPKALSGRVRDRAARFSNELNRLADDAPSGARKGTYACPQCAAPLVDAADVSPSGDVKCTYCHSWFNVRHG